MTCGAISPSANSRTDLRRCFCSSVKVKSTGASLVWFMDRKSLAYGRGFCALAVKVFRIRLGKWKTNAEARRGGHGTRPMITTPAAGWKSGGAREKALALRSRLRLPADGVVVLFVLVVEPRFQW